MEIVETLKEVFPEKSDYYSKLIPYDKVAYNILNLYDITFDQLKYLIEVKNVPLNTNFHYRSFLDYFAGKGDIEAVKYLINLNFRDPAAIRAASAEKHGEIVKLLFDEKESNVIVLIDFILNDDIDMVTWILDHKCYDVSDEKFIDYAVSKRNVDMVKLLLTHGFNKNRGIENVEATPEIMDLLIDNDDQLDSDFLLGAVHNDNVELVKYFLDKGLRNEEALDYAISKHLMKIVELMFQYDDNIDYNKAMNCAVEYCNWQAILLLLDRGVKTDFESIIRKAIDSKYYNFCVNLVKRGLDKDLFEKLMLEKLKNSN